MQKYRKTDGGRAKTRKYTHLQAKRNTQAAVWLRKNMPDVWKQICDEVNEREKNA
jgi:hypothetical protein